MSIGNDAAIMAVAIAEDDTHGYDQAKRWGPDYDCSSLVISIYSLLGVDLTCTYTGNMLEDFLKNGFTDVVGIVNLKTSRGMMPGDVLLHQDHAAMFIGSEKIVAARINEKGTTTGGKTGDQTGTEITTQKYYNHPWQHVLRPPDEVTVEPGELYGFPWVQFGSFGVHVYAVQAALQFHGYLKLDDLDGICGRVTEGAIKRFQADHGLEVDGIAGDKTLYILFTRS